MSAYESDLNRLCIAHAGLTGDSPGGSDAPAFSDFLRELRLVVDEDRRRLALVIFDCKLRCIGWRRPGQLRISVRAGRYWAGKARYSSAILFT